MGDWDLCPEPLGPPLSLPWTWGCAPGLNRAICGAGCLWAEGQAGGAGTGGCPLPGTPLRVRVGTQLQRLHHLISSLLPTPAPPSLSFPGVVTSPPSLVWPGVQGPGRLSKVGFPASHCHPDNTPTHPPPNQEKAVQRLSLLLRNFPSQAQDTLSTSSPS